MRIDAHQHFWLFDAVRDAWITENMSVIRRNFLPNDISQTLKSHNIDGIVAVQADQSPQETAFLIELAQYYKVIKGVVGWVDLRAENIGDLLKDFSESPIVKGFRHIVEGEADPDFLVQSDFLRGIKALTEFGYTYDLLIRPRHYASTLACVAMNPDQKFILDHMAKPGIKTGEFDEWAQFIDDLSKHSNVYCKISGLVTEAAWHKWQVSDFTRYIHHAIASFGKGRIIFGSDWPVSLLSATYEQTLQSIGENLSDFNEEDAADFWGRNAVRFYNLS